MSLNNPVAEALAEWLPKCDFAVLEHGFAVHGRDYVLVIQDVLGARPGTHRLTFTHVVAATYETAVRDDAWSASWDDVFLDWNAARDLEGYVWGTNWSNAYPGVSCLDADPDAAAWAVRLERPMHAALLETDRFRLRLIFHGFRSEQIGSETSIAGRVVFPSG